MGDRQPCPDRIFDDLGIGFTMGGVMGSLWNFGKGARNAARGERLAGAITTMKTRGPISGGNFGVWGGLFSTFECALMYYRGKEDFVNSITSGALTGLVLAIRGGRKAMFRSALFGGIFLGLIEGVGVLMNNLMAQQQQQMMNPEEVPEPPQYGFPVYNIKELDNELDFVPSHGENASGRY
ncbi:hypothetical protein FDP41_012662 [Naegleria fowleri]|uniref:Uncharacterized protein n=1 Tax=Naegleria fowleri TaxID=5763 RepID=A0A6A5C2W1_NAEFO|nr:uncharacterized protein FDP41_012662 [Naegleria fowleri]KAF0980874.1 hypothetical protein FDP41_012662 [Naegleria fowleri]